MHRIHCLNNISARGTDLLTDSYELTDSMDDATGVLVRSAAMHDTEFPDSLLAIGRAGAGVNNIPLDRCAQEGIVVFNTPGANANAVKELVICSMLLASRDIIGGVKWVRENADDPAVGKAAEKAKKAFAGHEIMGKKLGVIGLGAIGAMVANAAVDLGMDVYGYDPYVSVGAAWRMSTEVNHMTDLDQLLAECDFVTIHVPAVEGTIGMIDAHALACMKEGAVFLNFSRDTLVDAESMAQALETGRVGTYVTDFATPEVVKMEHTIVLPHLGASTAEAEDNCAMMATLELMDYIDNGTIHHSVNYPECDMGRVAEGMGRIAVLHGNEPNMVSRITECIGNAGVNIANLTNASRNGNAYTLIDTDEDVSQAGIDAIADLEGIRLVRVIA